MATKAAAPSTQFNLDPLDLQDMRVHIVGDSPLMVHAWSAKAKRLMLDKQTKKASRGREAKDPRADYLATSYRLADGRHGIPTVGIKNCAVTGCTSIHGVTKVAARQAFFIRGERAEGPGAFDGSITSVSLVPLLAAGPPKMREDLVTVGMGTADLRYRAEYWPWACEFIVCFNKRVLSPEQIVNLMDTAGFGVGLHEWRPECDGDNGRFHVARTSETKMLAKLKPVFDATRRAPAKRRR